MAATADYAFDSLHPPAIVHIPEEYNPEDPASPSHIDSPLSSPPNSPNAWDVDCLEDEDEEEANDNNDMQHSALDLPHLNHLEPSAGAGEPFDEGNDEKAVALQTIRDERRQRKMRRRQQLLNDQQHDASKREEQYEIKETPAEPDHQQADEDPLCSPVGVNASVSAVAKQQPATPEEQPFDATPTDPVSRDQKSHRRKLSEEPFDAPAQSIEKASNGTSRHPNTQPQKFSGDKLRTPSHHQLSEPPTLPLLSGREQHAMQGDVDDTVGFTTQQQSSRNHSGEWQQRQSQQGSVDLQGPPDSPSIRNQKQSQQSSGEAQTLQVQDGSLHVDQQNEASQQRPDTSLRGKLSDLAQEDHGPDEATDVPTSDAGGSRVSTSAMSTSLQRRLNRHFQAVGSNTASVGTRSASASAAKAADRLDEPETRTRRSARYVAMGIENAPKERRNGDDKVAWERPGNRQRASMIRKDSSGVASRSLEQSTPTTSQQELPFEDEIGRGEGPSVVVDRTHLEGKESAEDIPDDERQTLAAPVAWPRKKFLEGNRHVSPDVSRVDHSKATVAGDRHQKSNDHRSSDLRPPIKHSREQGPGMGRSHRTEQRHEEGLDGVGEDELASSRIASRSESPSASASHSKEKNLKSRGSANRSFVNLEKTIAAHNHSTSLSTSSCGGQDEHHAQRRLSIQTEPTAPSPLPRSRFRSSSVERLRDDQSPRKMPGTQGQSGANNTDAQQLSTGPLPTRDSHVSEKPTQHLGLTENRDLSILGKPTSAAAEKTRNDSYVDVTKRRAASGDRGQRREPRRSFVSNDLKSSTIQILGAQSEQSSHRREGRISPQKLPAAASTRQIEPQCSDRHAFEQRRFSGSDVTLETQQTVVDTQMSPQTVPATETTNRRELHRSLNAGDEPQITASHNRGATGQQQKIDSAAEGSENRILREEKKSSDDLSIQSPLGPSQTDIKTRASPEPNSPSVLRAASSPSCEHRRVNTHGSIEFHEHIWLPESKTPDSQLHSLSPDAPNSTTSLSTAGIDDGASWLAQRLHAREQRQRQMDEDASWLAERLGTPDQSSMDEGASWLAGRLEHSVAGDESLTGSIASGRRKSDAPGAAPLDPQGIVDDPKVARQFQQRGALNGQAQKAKRQAPDAEPSAEGSETRKPSRVRSRTPTKAPAQSDHTHSPVLIKDDATFPMVAATVSRNASPMAPSHDVGFLIESLDEMVKDLEVKVSSPTEASRKVRKPAYLALDDTNSATRPISSSSSYNSERQTGADLSSQRIFPTKPVLVQSINNDIGIPKGDIMISLLIENNDIPWSVRIEEAIWRCRTMRQNCDTKWMRQKLERKPNTPSNGRTSVIVDVDEARVVGGIESVAASQKAALEHLKYNDLDDAMSLYEDIVESYYAHFEEHLKQNTSVQQLDDPVVLFNACIGSCLHNMGIVYLLLKKPEQAFSYFERAATKRAATLGVGHTDHMASNVKIGTCHIALGRHTEAVVVLEECLALSKEGGRSISDQRQLAELYNNLACLYHALGNHEKSSLYLLESFEAQTVALEHSLYAGARFSCHSATLNLAVTKANIGFLALVSRNHEVAIESLEYAVHNQQLLLRDAHTTLIATMDHLVVAQIFAGNKDKAIRLLRRMYHMQSDAFGPTDERCMGTNKKLTMLEEAEPQKFGLHHSDELLDTECRNAEEKRRPNILKILKSMTRK